MRPLLRASSIVQRQAFLQNEAAAQVAVAQQVPYLAAHGIGIAAVSRAASSSRSRRNAAENTGGAPPLASRRRQVQNICGATALGGNHAGHRGGCTNFLPKRGQSGRGRAVRRRNGSPAGGHLRQGRPGGAMASRNGISTPMPRHRASVGSKPHIKACLGIARVVHRAGVLTTAAAVPPLFSHKPSRVRRQTRPPRRAMVVPRQKGVVQPQMTPSAPTPHRSRKGREAPACAGKHASWAVTQTAAATGKHAQKDHRQD